MRIAVYAICKNEEKFVKRWMASMREADGVFVCDTGSSDNSAALLREEGAHVNQITVSPWRFDRARNLSLAFVPENYDICVCTDLDEVFEAGWRNALEQAWGENTTQARYPYTWSFNDDGTPGVRFYIEKIHLRHGFQWVHPVHEVLAYNGEKEENVVTVDAMQLNHYPDQTKSRAQYLSLLELSVQESPEDDRNMHYLGREYMYYGLYDKSIQTLQRHLALKSATWKDERAASMRYIARCYQAKEEDDKASVWLYRAIAEAPYLREGYAEMAMLAYRLGNYPKVYHMVEEALAITQQPQSYIQEGFCHDSTLYDLGAVAAYQLGMYRQAYAFIKTATAMEPQNERLKNNQRLIEEKL